MSPNKHRFKRSTLYVKLLYTFEMRDGLIADNWELILKAFVHKLSMRS